MEIQQLTELQRHIEAVLFVAEQEVTAKELEQILAKNFGEDINKEVIQQALDALEEQYKSEVYSFYLVNISDGYRLLTKSDYHKTISLYLGIKSKKKLSRAAMETLAIVAYRQPITKGQIESIRGVSSDYGIQKLLEKELIAIVGRSEGVGRSLLYGTSKIFMDHFGLKSLKDLPKLSEVIPQHNQIGEGEEGQMETDTEKKDEVKSNEEDTEKNGVQNEEVQNESENKSEGEAAIEEKEALLKTENHGTLKQEGETDAQSEEHQGAELEIEGKTDGKAGSGKAETEGEADGSNEGREDEIEDEQSEDEQEGVKGQAEGGELEGETEQEVDEDGKAEQEVDGGGETDKTESEGEETNDEMGEEETPEIEIDEGLFEATNEIIAEGVENRPEAIEGAYDEPHPPTSQSDLSDEIE